jgi:predicted deacylase
VELLQTIPASDLRGQIVACPVVNPPAVFGHVNNSPLDGINLNRVFPGEAAGSPSERLAAWIFRELVENSNALVDLHSGGSSEDLLPFIGIRDSDDHDLVRRSRTAAEAMGFEHVILAGKPGGGTSDAAAARAGIVGLLVEVGQRGSRLPEQITQVKNGLLRLLKHLDMLDGKTRASDLVTKHWVWAGMASAPVDGLWYPSFEVGDDVKEGTELGVILDQLGQVIAVVNSPYSGRVIYGDRSLTVTVGVGLAAVAQREV